MKCRGRERHGILCHTVPGTRRLTRTGSGPIADEHRDMEVEEDDDYEAFLASVFVGRKCDGEVLYQHTYLEVECSFVFFLLGIFNDLLGMYVMEHTARL